MKRLFVLVLFSLSVSFFSCSSETEVQKKNYYGVEPENHGVPKNAYIALFGTLFVLGGLIVYGVNKIRNNK